MKIFTMKRRISVAVLAVVALAALLSPVAAMKLTDIPTKFPVPFGNSATSSFIRVVPQTTTDPCAASLNLGFPPNTFQPIGAGGCPPDGRDFNGILNNSTAWNRWQNAGGPLAYDSAFSTAINGYPKGTVLTSATFGQFWISTADDNTSDPDTGGANWIGFTPLNLYAIDSGTANTYIAAFVPNYSSPIDGVTVTVKIANSNTGTSTLNGVTIVRRDGSTLIGNELSVNQDAKFTYVASSNRYQLLGMAPTTAAASRAGIDTQSALTPSLFGGANQSLGTSGYQILPGGMIIQWGITANYNAEGGQNITLPIPFPNACLNAQATVIIAGPSGANDYWAQVYSLTTSALGIMLQLPANAATSFPVKINWVAIGY